MSNQTIGQLLDITDKDLDILANKYTNAIDMIDQSLTARDAYDTLQQEDLHSGLCLAGYGAVYRSIIRIYALLRTTSTEYNVYYAPTPFSYHMNGNLTRTNLVNSCWARLKLIGIIRKKIKEIPTWEETQHIIRFKNEL